MLLLVHISCPSWVGKEFCIMWSSLRDTSQGKILIQMSVILKAGKWEYEDFYTRTSFYSHIIGQNTLHGHNQLQSWPGYTILLHLGKQPEIVGEQTLITCTPRDLPRDLPRYSYHTQHMTLHACRSLRFFVLASTFIIHLRSKTPIFVQNTQYLYTKTSYLLYYFLLA